jgi:hypothetical protein
MTSPLPPSAGAGTEIRPVMAGQSYPGPNGEHTIASDDVVLVSLFTGGELVCTFTRPPETAIEIALAIQGAAVHIINNQVDDDGRKAPTLERIARINAAYKKAAQ